MWQTLNAVPCMMNGTRITVAALTTDSLLLCALCTCLRLIGLAVLSLKRALHTPRPAVHILLEMSVSTATSNIVTALGMLLPTPGALHRSMLVLVT
mmetsp:Transcript_115565/g.338063  ORF Transcript_115565/g.338063 Transcript_115565/m.338063 type:complete len:96 (+) Transcript_115565:483-770(+)